MTSLTDKLCCVALTALLIAFVPGCELADLFEDGTLGEIPFETLEASGHLAGMEPGAVVFRTRRSWEAFWYEYVNLWRLDSVPEPPPEIDFKRHIAVGLFWEATSGCFGAVEAFESVEGFETRVRVHIGPLPDLGPCDAIVYPQQIITFERTHRRVEFIGNVPE